MQYRYGAVVDYSIDSRRASMVAASPLIRLNPLRWTMSAASSRSKRLSGTIIGDSQSLHRLIYDSSSYPGMLNEKDKLPLSVISVAE